MQGCWRPRSTAGCVSPTPQAVCSADHKPPPEISRWHQRRWPIGCPSPAARCPPPAACPQFPANALVHRGELLAYITSDRIKGNAQLDGALEYLGKVRL